MKAVLSRRLLVVGVASLAVATIASDGLAHGTVVDSRAYRVRKAGQNANLMGAWTDAMWDWAANSRNFPDYAAPGVSYSNYIADGTISSAGQNNGTNGHLDFSKLNTPGAWPTSPATAGSNFAQKWVAPAPHDPSYFDVWITKQGFDVTTQQLGWGNLEKLGRWEKNTPLNVIATPGGATSPADNSSLLSYDWNVPIPADRAGRHMLIVVWQRRDPVGEAFFSTQDLLITPGGSSWGAPGNGNYFTAANWNGPVPNAGGSVANFGGAISAPSTVTLDASATIGTIRFDSAHGYTLAGSGTIMLDNHDHASGSVSDGKLDVLRGNHNINAGVMFHGNANASIANGATLNLGGPLTFSSGTVFLKTGAGTLRINSGTVIGASNAVVAVSAGKLVVDSSLSPSIGIHAGGADAEVQFNLSTSIRMLTTASGAKVKLSSEGSSPRVLKAASFGLGGNTTLDLGDGALIVDYTGGSMYAAVVGGVQSALQNNGGGKLLSGLATARHAVGVVEASSIGSPATFLSMGLDSTSVIARFTFKGDTNLDAMVNFDDLLALAQRYNANGTWRDGDSNYDGTVNFDDLLALAQNYNGSLATDAAGIMSADASFASDFALAMSLVPEPTMLCGLPLAATLLRRRRAD